MEIDRIIKQIEDLMVHYRAAGQYGELFGLKVALEIIKKETECCRQEHQDVLDHYKKLAQHYERKVKL